ncbi:lifeguard 1-like [Brachionus plicatilis]|uniref:Lifeguard 1-like n=1 Tax=Brachionus plicatilis TaxID=10195 RepID=A0A3M7T8H9_BRAPC|nr:lifeguard 1-like [Brachionus plicatilis]
MYNQDPYSQANADYIGELSSFSDVKIRHAFIRKTYSIVSLQVLITVAITALIVFAEPVRGFFYSNAWILWLAMIGTFVIMIVLACCESVNRKFPLNMILLMVFTLLESLLVGCISAQYETDTIFIALAITAVVVVGLTVFAFQTKIDFTGFGVYLFVFGLVLMVFGIISLIWRSEVLNILYAAFGAGLFSLYLVFDTQLMLGGKHKYSISPEDYIMAALNIYVDIINLFLLILRLVSAAKD